MKPEEAIKMLERIQDPEPYEPQITKSAYDALQMGVDALKKQIPMKAVGTHYAHMRCPSCNHRIPSGGGSSSRRRDNWCNYCGQKIDWSDYEISDN